MDPRRDRSTRRAHDLIRADVIPALTYEDATARFEYVVFSDSARQAEAVQYLDNRQVYGYIAFDEGGILYVVGGVERARSLLSGDLGGQGGLNPIAPISSTGAQNGPGISQDVRPGKPRVFGCFGQHGSGSTWMFNLVREICLAEGVDFVSIQRDSKASLPWDAPGSPLIVAKSHYRWRISNSISSTPVNRLSSQSAIPGTLSCRLCSDFPIVWQPTSKRRSTQLC
jgi:hypothetical protein